MKKLFSTFLIFFLLSNSTFALDYSKYNPSDINAIREATKDYQNEYKDKKGTKEAEIEFLKFRDFYYEAVDKQNQLINNFSYKAKNGSYQEQAQEYSKKYYKKGFIVHFDEGDFFLVQCERYIYENFAPYLNEEWQELLIFETRFDKRIISDGRYIIPKSELVEILKFYQSFYKKYPDFIDLDYVKNIIKFYQKQIKQYPNVFS